MLRWLLAGSLALGISSGAARAGEEPAPAGPETGNEISTVALASQGTAKKGEAKAKEGAAPSAQQPAQPGAQEPKKDDTGKGEAKGGEEEESKKPAPTGPWHITGTADFYWENNFDDPFTGKNALRAFDIWDAGGVHANFAGIQIAHDRKPWGFRLDIGAGDEASLLNFAEPNPGSAVNKSFRYMQQIYGSLNLDKKGTTYVDFGKWFAQMGFETAYARDNWNYSRSLLYNFAEPFYHLGGRIYHYFNTTDYVNFNVTRGWNRVGTLAGNDNIAGGVAFGKGFGKKTVLGVNYMVGKEPDFVTTTGDYRHSVDLVLTYNASAKWLFALNADYWHQDNFFLTPLAGPVNADVVGAAGYARYVMNKKQALSLRAEVLDDADGAAGTGAAQTVWETTLSFEHRFNKYMLTKLEYRHDSSDVLIFPKSVPGTFAHGQDTLGAALILSY
jgi:Putative beta-barrel porin-2, OmpL-like. bbp2